MREIVEVSVIWTQDDVTLSCQVIPRIEPRAYVVRRVFRSHHRPVPDPDVIVRHIGTRTRPRSHERPEHHVFRTRTRTRPHDGGGHYIIRKRACGRSHVHVASSYYSLLVHDVADPRAVADRDVVNVHDDLPRPVGSHHERPGIQRRRSQTGSQQHRVSYVRK